MKPLHSMTGFSLAEGSLNGLSFRVEARSLNHRFLDLKLRLPKELADLDARIRAKTQSALGRGSVEIKIELVADPKKTSVEFEPNLAVAANYYECLRAIQKTFGLNDPIRTSDLLACPDVIARKGADPLQENGIDAAWNVIEPVLANTLGKLVEMRTREGLALKRALLASIDSISEIAAWIRTRRKESEPDQRDWVRQKIDAIFQAWPLPSPQNTGNALREVIEARAAQELALLLERTDIEEELTRLQGHLDHFRHVIEEGSPAGRKLDFILQEIHREVNTLGNKAQDAAISERVVLLKVQTEQLREQVMNIE